MAKKIVLKKNHLVLGGLVAATIGTIIGSWYSATKLPRYGRLDYHAAIVERQYLVPEYMLYGAAITGTLTTTIYYYLKQRKKGRRNAKK